MVVLRPTPKGSIIDVRTHPAHSCCGSSARPCRQSRGSGSSPDLEPRTVTERLSTVKRILGAVVAAAVLVPALASCRPDESPRADPVSATPSHPAGGVSSRTVPSGQRALTDREVALAVSASVEEAASAGASVESATAFGRRGSVTVRESNTGRPCSSGRRLEVELIGSFPHTVTTGSAVRVGAPASHGPAAGTDGARASDSLVVAMVLTVDSISGDVCLIGVQTAEGGEAPQPRPGASVLDLG